MVSWLLHRPRKFNNLVTQYAGAGEPDPVGKALADVMVDFEKDKAKQGFITQNGYPSMRPDRSASDASSANLRRYIEKVDTYIGLYGDKVIDEPNILFSQEQIQSMVKGYGKEGWTVDPQITYIADRLGADPLTVLNAQLKANGMDSLPPSPAIEAINQLTPKQAELN